MVAGSRYCVVCGRREEADEPLINGYCSDCYLERVGVFDAAPVLELIVCSRCGAWYYKGRWVDGVSVSEALRRLLLDWADKHLTSGVELVEVEDIGELRPLGHGWYEAVFVLTVVLANTAVRKKEVPVRIRLVKALCPRCMRRAGKGFNALIQFRSTRGYLTEEEKRYIRERLMSRGVAEEVVEIIENKQGIDAKIGDQVVARRVAAIVSRERDALVKETFKLRRYDPGRGKKEGVVTLSVRLHDIGVGDVMEYRGRPCIVRGVRHGRVSLEFLDNGERLEVSISEFWDGALKKSERVVRDAEYTVVGYDSSSLYLVRDDTGEMVEYPRLVNLNTVRVGDKLVSYRVADKMYLARKGEEKHGS